jgi:hypothetical protein
VLRNKPLATAGNEQQRIDAAWETGNQLNTVLVTKAEALMPPHLFQDVPAAPEAVASCAARNQMLFGFQQRPPLRLPSTTTSRPIATASPPCSFKLLGTTADGSALDLQLSWPPSERALQQVLHAVVGESAPGGERSAALDPPAASLATAGAGPAAVPSGPPVPPVPSTSASVLAGASYDVVPQPPVCLVNLSPQLLTDSDFTAHPQPQRDLVLMQRRSETPDLVQSSNGTLAESLAITDSSGQLHTNNQTDGVGLLDTASTATLIGAEYALELGLVPQGRGVIRTASGTSDVVGRIFSVELVLAATTPYETRVRVELVAVAYPFAAVADFKRLVGLELISQVDARPHHVPETAITYSPSTRS